MNERHLHLTGLAIVLLTLALAFMAHPRALAQRRITPVNTAATATQPINETKNDTARINAARRASMQHYHDENGRTIYVDTISGMEWIDSTALIRKVPMKYPLLHSLDLGINIWDPVMRLFGQHYGIADIMAQVNLHNRYLPTLELGVGQARNTPAGLNYTYRSPLSFYARIGADYNFLYNSDPHYQFHAGVRYGFSPFSFSLTNVSLVSGYWGEDISTDIPSQRVSAGWLELSAGLRVRLWGALSAGWTFKFHTILHKSSCDYGDPWYIPGYGASGRSISGAFHLIYTIPLSGNKAPKDSGTLPPSDLPADDSSAALPGRPDGQPN